MPFEQHDMLAACNVGSMLQALICQQLANTSTCMRRFEGYEEDAEGVTVRFQGGVPSPVRAKVLIGADGFFSAVRQQCLGDGPPDFAVRAPPAHFFKYAHLTCRVAQAVLPSP